jgi:MFS family permease
MTGLQWTMTAYLLTCSACMLPGGRPSDAIGVCAVLLCGIGLYLGAMVVVAGAPDLPGERPAGRKAGSVSVAQAARNRWAPGH